MEQKCVLLNCCPLLDILSITLSENAACVLKQICLAFLFSHCYVISLHATNIYTFINVCMPTSTTDDVPIVVSF